MAQEKLNLLNSCLDSLNEIKDVLLTLKKEELNQPMPRPPVARPEVKSASEEITEEVTEETEEIKNKEFAELRLLASTDEWPDAVDPTLICDVNLEEDKLERAEGILELMINVNMQDKKFLDFGCGEGHVAVKAKELGVSQSVGYDIVTKGKLSWENEEDYLLTTELDKVKEKGPYDIIFLYDVLDHLVDAKMGETLSLLKSLLSERGSIFARCHPWCSRHGGHLYLQKNKAFVHLVFTEDELYQMDLTPEPNQKVCYPLTVYRKAIQDAELVIESEEIERTSVENFFYENELVKSRIEKHWPSRNEFPIFQTEQSFVDYILIK